MQNLQLYNRSNIISKWFIYLCCNILLELIRVNNNNKIVILDNNNINYIIK
jgi:hypothetical protein